jgi:hypothetical protein
VCVRDAIGRREGQEDQLLVLATVSVLFRGVIVKLEAWDAAVMSTVPKQSRPAPTIAPTYVSFLALMSTL